MVVKILNIYALLQCYMFGPYKAIFRQHFYKESNALRTNQISFFQLRQKEKKMTCECLFNWIKKVFLFEENDQFPNDLPSCRRTRKWKQNEFGAISTSFLQGVCFIIIPTIREILSSWKPKLHRRVHKNTPLDISCRALTIFHRLKLLSLWSSLMLFSIRILTISPKLLMCRKIVKLETIILVVGGL
jgi:hypothetical protein